MKITWHEEVLTSVVCLWWVSVLQLHRLGQVHLHSLSAGLGNWLELVVLASSSLVLLGVTEALALQKNPVLSFAWGLLPLPLMLHSRAKAAQNTDYMQKAVFAICIRHQSHSQTEWYFYLWIFSYFWTDTYWVTTYSKSTCKFLWHGVTTKSDHASSWEEQNFNNTHLPKLWRCILYSSF